MRVKVIIFADDFDAHRVAVKIRVSKKIGNIAKIENGKKCFAEFFIDAGATTDNLLELGHGSDVAVKYDKFAGLRIHSGGHKFGCGGNNRVEFFRIDKVIQLAFAFFVIASDLHDVFGVVYHQITVGIGQRCAHTLGMFDIHAEHYGLVEVVGLFQVFGNSVSDSLGTLVNHKIRVVILAVIDTVINQLTAFIGFARFWPPAFQINIQPNR